MGVGVDSEVQKVNNDMKLSDAIKIMDGVKKSDEELKAWEIVRSLISIQGE